MKNWLLKISNQIYTRILLALLMAGLITGGIWGTAYIIVENLSLIKYQKAVAAEEKQLKEEIDNLEKVVGQEGYTFQQVIEEELFDHVTDHDLYISGTDGKIYLKGRQEGIEVSEVDLTLRDLYLFGIEYEDGYGYVIVRPGIEAASIYDFEIYLFLCAILVFILLGFIFVNKELKKGIPLGYEPATEIEETLRRELKEQEKPKMNLAVFIQQYVAEQGITVRIEGKEKVLYYTRDMESLMNALDAIFEKIEEIKAQDTSIEMSLEAKEKTAELIFRFLMKDQIELFPVELSNLIGDQIEKIQGSLCFGEKADMQELLLAVPTE